MQESIIKWTDADGNKHEIIKSEYENGKFTCKKFVNGVAEKKSLNEQTISKHPIDQLVDMRNEIRKMVKHYRNTDEFYEAILSIVDSPEQKVSL